MRRALKAGAIVAILFGVALAENKKIGRLAEPWNAPYTGEDATGDHVVGLWNFEAGAELKDGSGNGHDLTLHGAKVVAGGRFGGCLESWPVGSDLLIPHQARAKAAPELPPMGAFTVEMWIKPKPEIEGYASSFLLDNRYVDESGMQLILTADSGAGRRLQMLLGISGQHPNWISDCYIFKPGIWYHVAFTYDGKGSGRFYVNGMFWGGQDRPEYGAVTPGVKYLSIGDRVGANHRGFPGYIDQVRICKGVLEFSRAGFEVVSPRKVFVRMENEAKVRFALINKQRSVLSGAKVTFSLAGIPQLEQSVPDLKPGEQHMIDLLVDTSLRPDTYALMTTAQLPGENDYRSTQEFEITIVPRKIPYTMPVVMWGGSADDIDWLTKLGFTHYLVNWVDFNKVWKAGKPTEPATAEKMKKAFAELDKALAHGMGVVAGLSPGRWARRHEKFRRIGANGKHPSDDVCGLFPELPKFCYNVGASLSAAYGSHPGMQCAMVHTEVRGDSRLCYHEHDRQALKDATGLDDIPKGLEDIWAHRGTPYKKIPNFPANRVIPDNYPMYVYYKWFWKEGDGWNAMHTALHNGFKSRGHDHLWTFHDPAVRVPSVYGNGGDVDYLSHWTYVYPDPIRIGLCTDELFCMANGAQRGDQQVMKMTQIIWYRSQTAPEPGEKATSQASDSNDQDVRIAGTGQVGAQGHYQAKWEQENPDARFITIAPMQLREALWSKISRPIKGIMYHGWGSLVPIEKRYPLYRYTNPETKWELKRLIETVVQPLGPTLMQIPDRKSDVAFLESFASQMFALRGTWGWCGGWEGEAYLILQYTGLQPRVIYEETVQQEGLNDFKILVMPVCDVLPESVVSAVLAFQKAGGIIVGDENLCPVVKPDILLPTHKRPTEADKARTMNIEAAAKLREQLDKLYQRYAESSTPDVITRVRNYGSTDYLFAVNDLREFGDYVGHHKLVMENGLPTDAKLSIRRPGAHVYDLLSHRKVTARSGDDMITISQNFGPCEGRVFMITDQAIDKVNIDAPKTVAPGNKAPVKVTIIGDDGKPMKAVVPVRIDLIDPSGRVAEFSGYYGAKDGKILLTADIASNDKPGLWRIHVRELASGMTADAYMRIMAER